MPTRNVRFVYAGDGPPERTATDRVLFCDGTNDAAYEPGRDLELSHWIPNHTPDAFKADTSTEICLEFIDSGPLGEFTVASNNHVDLDGLLSAFVLVEPSISARHRDTLVALAEAGDFWLPLTTSQARLYEALTRFFSTLKAEGRDGQEINDRFFTRCAEVLEDPDRCGEAGDAGETAQRRNLRFLSEDVERTVRHRLASYEVSRAAAETRRSPDNPVMPFGESLCFPTVFPPHARAQVDDATALLVCVEAPRGWQYDLWYPGYSWADVVDRWIPPGRVVAGGRVSLHCPELSLAVESLAKTEGGRGRWLLAESLNLGKGLSERGYPVVASFVDGKRPGVSTLHPRAVLDALAPVFAW
jgi:hypothetical protein